MKKCQVFQIILFLLSNLETKGFQKVFLLQFKVTSTKKTNRVFYKNFKHYFKLVDL